MVKRYSNTGEVIGEFLACDLDSKGGFSYWFRSPTVEEGFNKVELPYAKKLEEGAFDSYCGVIPPSSNRPASAQCVNVAGLGFGSGTIEDPDPPEHIRVRLRTYENLLYWVPLVNVGKEVSVLKDKLANRPLIVEPKVDIEDGLKTSGGTPFLRSTTPFPLNETNGFSIMIKPNASASSGSEEIIFFAGDDAELNEVSIRKTVKNQIRFLIYEGKTEVFNFVSGRVTPGEWNHILLQYHNGYWYLFINGKHGGRKYGPRHSFMKRSTGIIGRPLPQHDAGGFMGHIADIRLYSNTQSQIAMNAIIDDFKRIIKNEKYEATSS